MQLCRQLPKCVVSKLTGLIVDGDVVYSVRTGQVRNVESAKVSMVGQLKK